MVRTDYCKIIKNEGQPDKVRVGIRCSYCGEKEELIFLKKEYEDWLLKKSLFPSADEVSREIIRYKLCRACLTKEE